MDCRVFKLARCRAKISTRADRQRSERADQSHRHKEADGERAARRLAAVYLFSTAQWPGTILLYISTTPGSKLLKEEVGTALLRSHFIPAIYNGERTEVLVIGTVVLLVADGKPHLRIYMNQNHDDVSKGNDFVAPQLVANSPDWAAGRYHPAAYKAAVNMQNAWIGLSITADANGNQKDLRISVEEPAGFGVGAAAKDVFAKASMDSRFPQRPSGRVYVRFHHMGRHRAYPSRGKALTGQSLGVPKLRQFALEKTAHSACVYASCALWHFP